MDNLSHKRLDIIQKINTLFGGANGILFKNNVSDERLEGFCELFQKAFNALITEDFFDRRPMTLDEALQRTWLSKFDMLSAFCFGKQEFGPANSPRVKIETKDDMDKARKVVALMEKCYEGRDDDTSRYYRVAFESIQKAYDANDLEEFNRAIDFLLDSIRWD
jgi:hypothetical protein